MTLPQNPEQLKAQNIRGIALSLPGCGYTSAAWPRRIGDWPRTDLAPVLEAEGVDEFMIEGTSEGSGHAMAAAWHFGKERVTAVGLYVPWVPNPICDEIGLPHQGEETPRWLNQSWFEKSRFSWAVLLGIRAMRVVIQTWPNLIAGQMTKSLRDEFPDFPPAFAAQTQRACRHSPHGLVCSIMHDTMWADWGFDVRDLRVAKALVVHVRDDAVCPVEHGQWLAKHLEGTGAQVAARAESSGGHVCVLRHLISGELSKELASLYVFNWCFVPIGPNALFT